MPENINWEGVWGTIEFWLPVIIVIAVVVVIAVVARIIRKRKR